MADPVVNFGYSTVMVAPSPEDSGTTIEFADPSVFPNPYFDGAYNLVVWPAGVALPLSSNAEIVRCVTFTFDEDEGTSVTTIDRAQEGTAARAIVAGDQVALAATAKTFTDLAAGGGGGSNVVVQADDPGAIGPGNLWVDTGAIRQGDAPSPRHDVVMSAYASVGRVVLFGGLTPLPTDETWAWNGSGWGLQGLATDPTAQRSPAMFNDEANGVVIMFGGTALLNQTWSFDNMDWTLLTPGTSPSARQEAVAAYDRVRSKGIMFGGLDAGSVFLDETWSWDGADWTQLSPATTPAQRVNQGMAYDAANDRIVMFGGYVDGVGSVNETWLWDGTDWTLATPASSPPGREFFGMAYDEVRQQVVLFGGIGKTNDTWLWDGTNWAQATPANSPEGRDSCAMCWDPATSRVILFGGTGADELDFDDTWGWNGTDWTRAPAAAASLIKIRNLVDSGWDHYFGPDKAIIPASPSAQDVTDALVSLGLAIQT